MRVLENGRCIRSPYMAKTTNIAQREDHIELVGRMRLRGYTQTEIGKALGISQRMVSYNEAIVRKRMKERLQLDHDTLVKEKIAQYEDIRREAWAAYDKSQADAQKEVEEFATHNDEDGGSLLSSEVRIKRITTREGRLPSNAYLSTIMATLQAERELLGLDALKGPQTVVNVFNFDLLAAVGGALGEPAVDSIEAKIRELEEGGTDRAEEPAPGDGV